MNKIFLNGLASAVLVGIGFNPIAAVADECTTVTFSKGHYSAEFQENVGENETDCYTVTTGANQTMKVDVYDKKGNTAASIAGVGDGRDHFKFKTNKTTYQIIVSQVKGVSIPSKYRLVIDIR